MNIFMRFQQGKEKALTFSYDDGVLSDRKLIEIFDKNNLKCTFNIGSGLFSSEEEAAKNPDPTRRMSLSEAAETYSGSAHEVAIHGVTHPFMEQLPGPAALYEGIQDRKSLEDIFHTVVRGMAYPYGTLSDSLVSSLKAAGIAYSRTTRATHSFDIPSEWLRLDPTCHHNDTNLEELADKFVNFGPSDERCNKKPWLLYIWGHSYEFVRDNNWDRIEKLAEKLSGKDDIWYATNIEIYDYVDAYNRLIFSVDASIVTNPSAIEIWFEANKKIISVRPGETKKIC